MSIQNSHNRMTFLKNAGVVLSLPTFESFAKKSTENTSSKKAHPKRFFVMANPLGMVPGAFHPAQAGSKYELPELLQSFNELKQDISLFSHLDHGLRGGHEMTHAFLSGVQQKEAMSMPHGNVSLDQWIAEKWIGKTRYTYLCTKAGSSRTGGFSSPALSWTKDGVNIPPIHNARVLFEKLFISDSKEHKQFKKQQFKRHASILDAIHRQAKSIQPQLSKSDQHQLDDYFTSIRQVERKVELEKYWLNTPKPQTDLKTPEGAGLHASLHDFFELLFWAFKTDITKVATLEIPGDESGRDFGLEKSYHTYSHHGQSDENLKGVKVFESFQMQALAEFIQRLKQEPDPTQSGSSMLDTSLVLFGSGLSNASAHTNTNLPVLLAGGGFRHGQHHIYDENKKTPLSNLWLSILHRFGFEDTHFGRSTGTLTGYPS